MPASAYMKEPVEVEIMGQRLTVASDDGPEHVRQVARLVDAQVRRLSESHPGTSIVHLALLVALNAGSELEKVRLEQEGLGERLRLLSDRVDTGLLR